MYFPLIFATSIYIYIEERVGFYEYYLKIILICVSYVHTRFKYENGRTKSKKLYHRKTVLYSFVENKT